MGNAISTCLSKYATFSGRASRSEYWFFVLFTALVGFISGIIAGVVGSDVLGYVIQAVFWIPGLAVSIRRMHDVDKSGWFVLVPIYGFILSVTPGTVGSNRFGD
jgi:uncharacterized membrane protein YhaH (DUF805 family)